MDVAEIRGKNKAAKRPYMKLFTSDYRDGTARLSFELQGFYFRILTILHDGDRVPADSKSLGVMMQCDPRKAARLTRELISAGKLYELDGELRNRRVDRDTQETSPGLRPDFEEKSNGSRGEVEEKSERTFQKTEPNQDQPKAYYGESHFHCHSHSQKDSTVNPASIPDAARERLAGLNGSLELIWSDVIAWGVDPDQAAEYIASVVDANGPEIARDAHAKLKADLILGADIRSPAAVFPHVARRMRVGQAAASAMTNKTSIMVEAIRTMGALQ